MPITRTLYSARTNLDMGIHNELSSQLPHIRLLLCANQLEKNDKKKILNLGDQIEKQNLKQGLILKDNLIKRIRIKTEQASA